MAGDTVVKNCFPQTAFPNNQCLLQNSEKNVGILTPLGLLFITKGLDTKHSCASSNAGHDQCSVWAKEEVGKK